MRRVLAITVLAIPLGLGLSVTQAIARDLPAPGPAVVDLSATSAVDSAPVAAPAGSATSLPIIPAERTDPGRRGRDRGKTVYYGLIAAAFLIFCGAAGANDRPQGDRPKSRRPPPA